MRSIITRIPEDYDGSPWLPKYLYHDQIMDTYFIRKDHKIYGTFKNEEDARATLKKLELRDWDIRIGHGLPEDLVEYNPKNQVYTIHKKIDGHDHIFDQFQEVHNVKEKLKELDFLGWPLHESKGIR